MIIKLLYILKETCLFFSTSTKYLFKYVNVVCYGVTINWIKKGGKLQKKDWFHSYIIMK